MQQTCRVLWLGKRDYQEAWDLQRRMAAQRLTGEIPDTLLLLEHPPTITMGRRGDQGHIVAAPDQIAAEGVTMVQSDRGGDVTYHGPGQLVGYPILNLQAPPHRPNLHLYLRNIEETLIQALATFDVDAGRFDGYTGVWTNLSTSEPRKVAAIGIRISRWITHHGFALNVCPNLAHFDLIVPCGIREYGVTSVARLLERKISVEDVLPSVVQAFGRVFDLDCIRES